jgi:hypothetical protein
VGDRSRRLTLSREGSKVANAPSTTLRVVPLPRFAGEEPTPRQSQTPILPRLRGRGTAEGGGGGVCGAILAAAPSPAFAHRAADMTPSGRFAAISPSRGEKRPA